MSGSYAPNFSALSSGKLWALTAAALLVTCLLKGMSEKMPRTVEKRELPWVCMEAAFVEVALRLMMQSFVIYLLDAWGCAAIWCVFLNALIWCAGIVIQGVLAKQTMGKNFVLGQHRTIRQEVSGRILFQFKVPKMEEYCMYFPFSELRKWSKKTDETRRRNCAVLPLI